MEDKPLVELRPGIMKSVHHSVIVQHYLLDQLRVQLCDSRLFDSHGNGHGQIVRECCTYDRAKALAVVVELFGADDPVSLIDSWARPWNQENPGGRIKLDAEEKKPAG